MATTTATKVVGTSHLSDYMEALARNSKADVPEGYGYKGDVQAAAGFFMEAKTGCAIHQQPVVLPSGQPGQQGYMMLYAYCGKEGKDALLEGNLPPMLPATTKAPNEFASLEAIASNFGAAKPTEAKENSKYCFAFRVPTDITSKADTGPDRDIWIIRLDQDVITPFVQAAIEGDAAKLTEGLKGGISAKTVDHRGTSVLMMAANAGSADACKVLLDKDADVNYAEPVGAKTALMFAAQGGHMDAVKLLLERKADASKVDTEKCTALMWAATAGKAEMVRLLLLSGGKECKNAEGMTAMAIAKGIGHAEVVAALEA